MLRAEAGHEVHLVPRYRQRCVKAWRTMGFDKPCCQFHGRSIVLLRGNRCDRDKGGAAKTLQGEPAIHEGLALLADQVRAGPVRELERAGYRPFARLGREFRNTCSSGCIEPDRAWPGSFVYDPGSREGTFQNAGKRESPAPVSLRTSRLPRSPSPRNRPRTDWFPARNSRSSSFPAARTSQLSNTGGCRLPTTVDPGHRVTGPAPQELPLTEFSAAFLRKGGAVGIPSRIAGDRGEFDFQPGHEPVGRFLQLAGRRRGTDGSAGAAIHKEPIGPHMLDSGLRGASAPRQS